MKMKTGIIFILLADFVCGWDILTATLDPPTNPILEGETVTAKVVMSFEDGQSWSACNWYNGNPNIDDAACKQTPGNAEKGDPITCAKRSQESIETFPVVSGGDYNPKLCQLVIEDISTNYTGHWTVIINGGKDGINSTHSTYIPITTTRVANVTGEEGSIKVTNGQRFQASCKASFGVPMPAGFSWEIDNEEGKINDWDPCLGTPNYGSNITNTISLTAPSTGSEGTYEYTLSCISVQYFGQTENETLKNHVDMNIVVTEENEKGSNITNISTPWLIILIVVCCLVVLLLLLLLWSFCTKTLCFASRDRNNNVVRGTQGGQVVGTKSGKANKKATQVVEKRDIRLVENNDEQMQTNSQYRPVQTGANKMQELKVVNPYDNDNQRFNSNRPHDTLTNNSSRYADRQGSENLNKAPSQESRNLANVYRLDDEGSIIEQNKKRTPVYSNPPGVTNLRSQIENDDNFQMHNRNNQRYGGSGGNIKEEVIYAKPSFENSSGNPRNSSLSTRPPKSPRSAASLSLNRNENWNVEADQSTANNVKSNSLRPMSSYLTKANALYQNENVGPPPVSNKPSSRYEFQSPSLSRQSSAFSSYSREKDTLV